MSETVAPEKAVRGFKLPSFVVENTHPQNCDILLQSIPGIRLRSSLKPVIRNVDGKTLRTPQMHQRSLPTIPGMRLQVDPATLSYTVHDPLHEDKDARARLLTYLIATGAVQRGRDIRVPDDVTAKLDVHRMKTLCREILGLVQAGEMSFADGSVAFDIMEVDSMPGKYLLNPGSRISNTQPRFEEDYDAWVDRMTRNGGG